MVNHRRQKNQKGLHDLEKRAQQPAAARLYYWVETNPESGTTSYCDRWSIVTGMIGRKTLIS